MDKISYSALKLVKECPACFWWQVKKGIRRESTVTSQLPNVIEKQVLNGFESYRKEKKLPPEYNIPELKDFRLVDLELHEKWKNPFSGEPCYEGLSANPDDVLVNGKKIIVVDIKTLGKSSQNCTTENILNDIEKYSYKSQLEFYTYIFKKLGYEVENKGYLLFYFLGDLRDGKIELKHELISVKIDLKNVETLLKKARKILKRESPPNHRCKFCSSHKQRYKDYQGKQKAQGALVDEVVFGKEEL